MGHQGPPLVLPIQYTQIRKADLEHEGLPSLNVQMSQIITRLNAMLGVQGPSPLYAGVDVRGARVTNLGAPVGPNDAISSGHAASNYAPAVTAPDFDLGGKNALKGLTATFQQATQTQTQVTGFTVSTASLGYQKLPSGEIEQWGHTPATLSTSPTTITFPIPFPTACFVVVATDDFAGGNARIISVISVSTTGFSIRADGTGNGAWWRALGN